MRTLVVTVTSCTSDAPATSITTLTAATIRLLQTPTMLFRS